MKARHRGGEEAPGGTYWGLGQMDWVTVPAAGGRLPGSGDTGYIKVPALLPLLVGPLFGLFYVLLVPLLAILLVAALLTGKLRDYSALLARATLQVLTPRPRPGVSYLQTPRSKQGGTKHVSGEDATRSSDRLEKLLEELEDEIKQLRQDKG